MDEEYKGLSLDQLNSLLIQQLSEAEPGTERYAALLRAFEVVSKALNERDKALSGDILNEQKFKSDINQRWIDRGLGALKWAAGAALLFVSQVITMDYDSDNVRRSKWWPDIQKNVINHSDVWR